MRAAPDRFWRTIAIIVAALTVTSAPTGAIAADKTPWKADVAYDAHDLDKLDIYRPARTGAVPAVLFIHAGGWWNGDKSYVPASTVNYFTQRGIAFVAINYRNLPSAQQDGLFPPLLGPLLDAQRALQFVRYHARDYGIDPSRIALLGESAGAFDALWLGLTKDRADPSSPDPVARMSTRVAAIGAADPQTSIDPAQMRRWVGPRLRYGGHAFGLPEADFDQFLARRADFARYFPRLSPAALVHAGEPPVYLSYQASRDDTSQDPMYYVHSPAFGSGFARIAAARHAEVTLRIGARQDPGAEDAFLNFLARSVAPDERTSAR